MSQRQKTILIVDHSQENCELYQYYLQEVNEFKKYNIVFAESGQVGLELWNIYQPDLVLLDFRLPDMNGVEFIKRLQTITCQQCLPIIVITEFGNEAIAVQVIKAGAQNYFNKNDITAKQLRLAADEAIGNLQLLTQQKQNIQKEQLITQITKKLYKSLNLNEILEITVTQVRQFLNADRVIILQLDSYDGGNVVAESVESTGKAIMASRICDSAVGEDDTKGDKDPNWADIYLDQNSRQGLVRATTDIDQSNIDGNHRELLVKFQVRADLVVPIWHDHDFWGLLIAHQCTAPRQWQQLEIDLLQDLATHVSIALRQSEALDQAKKELAERKQAETNLKESEIRLRLALEAARMGTWEWNLLTGEIHWSENLEALFGLEPGEFDASFAMFTSRVHPDDVDFVVKSVNAAINTGAEYKIEFRVVYPNGKIRWALSQGKVFYDQTGQPVRMAGVDLDISDRKRSETELRENAAWLKLAQQATKSGLWDLDIATGVVRVSEEYSTLFGFEPGTTEINYENWLRLLHPDDQSRSQQYIAQMLSEQRQYYDVEFRVLHPDGIRWLAAKVQVFYDADGKAIRKTGSVQDITDSKQVAIAFQENQQFLQMSLESANAGLWNWEIPLGKLVWSVENYHLYGVDPAKTDLTFADWNNCLHPGDREHINNEINRILTQRLPEFNFEFRIIHPQRGICWILAVGRLCVDYNGEPIRLSGLNLDISERKQAEKLLKSSEERLQLSLEGSGNGLWDWNITTGELYLSPRWLEMLGYEVGELPNHVSTWEKLIYPEDKAFVEEILNAHLLDSSVPYKFDYRVLTKSGEAKWIGNYGKVVLRDENGNPLRMAGIHQDISDRKRSEAYLRQSEIRYRYLAETIPHLVWTCDANGSCDYVNQRLCDYTGLTNEQALGFGWLGSVHPDDLESCQAAWSNAVNHRTFYKHEYRFLRNSDSAYRWHLILGLPLKDEQGKVIKWFGTCTDIHDQKELEIERDRVLQLEQAARNEAERANRVKDEFLAILSHELRSPLNPILGWTKLLQGRKLDADKMAQGLATIERNAKLQAKLIDDLLDIARILRGKLNLNTEPVNLTFVIEAAIDTVRTAAVAKSILIDAQLKNIGQVSGDATRLQQIVWNLLSNAIKFTPNGGQVEIRLQNVDNQAQITVTDTGKGINADFLPHIFESFRQEDVSITRKYGGLGLGLAIVRHLVEAHGGTVAVDSPGEGKGSTFTVSLPLLNVEPQSDRCLELALDRLDLAGIKILTIDDEPDARELLQVLLTNYGAEVMSATNSYEFLTAVESFQPDVLVSDIGMPEVDGYTLIRQVRSLEAERGGQIPAIALTAYAGEINQQQALGAGFQMHLAKPIDPIILAEAIAKLIRQ